MRVRATAMLSPSVERSTPYCLQSSKRRFASGRIFSTVSGWRGSLGEYQIGSNAALYAQIEAHERIQDGRKRIWNVYSERLADWAAGRGVGLPHVPAHCDQAYHMFFILLPSLAERQALIAHLRARGILAVFHYQPLHLSAMGQRFGGRPGDCPVTEDIADRLLRLPFYNGMTESEQERVIEAVVEF